MTHLVAPPHQCVTTMKSVSFPFSWLNPLSEIINEEAGVSSSELGYFDAVEGNAGFIGRRYR